MTTILVVKAPISRHKTPSSFSLSVVDEYAAQTPESKKLFMLMFIF